MKSIKAMKKNHLIKQFLAASLAGIMILTAFTGCSNRNAGNEEQKPPEQSDNTQTTPENQPQEPESPEDQTPGTADSQSGGSSSDEGSGGDTPSSSDTPSADASDLSNVPVDESALNPASKPAESAETPDSVPPAAQVQSTDLVELGTLDSTKLGWGPGGPVDEYNRSSGALSYQEKYGKYDADFIGDNEQKIYLTFDEGYENGYTSQILDVLKEKGVSAVFFVTMPYVKSNPELIKRMIDEGHAVGNHSVNHPSFPETPLTTCRDEVTQLHDYMKENYNYTMRLFRFPMGEFNEQDLKLLQDLGYRSVFWSFAYRDWLVEEQPDPTEAMATILDKCHPGGIYLLHAVSKTNTEILGQVIDGMRAKGYEVAPYPAS